MYLKHLTLLVTVKVNPQIQRTGASNHIYVIQRPVTNVKASFCV